MMLNIHRGVLFQEIFRKCAGGNGADSGGFSSYKVAATGKRYEIDQEIDIRVLDQEEKRILELSREC